MGRVTRKTCRQTVTHTVGGTTSGGGTEDGRVEGPVPSPELVTKSSLQRELTGRTRQLPAVNLAVLIEAGETPTVTRAGAPCPGRALHPAVDGCRGQ